MNPPLATHPRRTYSPEFKAQLITLCQQPDASVVDLALAHDVDVALLLRWIRRQADSLPRLPPGLVPILLAAPIAAAQPDDALRLEITTSSARVMIHCPASRVGRTGFTHSIGRGWLTRWFGCAG